MAAIITDQVVHKSAYPRIVARWTTATALVLFTAVLSYCQSPSTAPNVPEILSMHHQPFFWDVMVASVVGWVLGMVKGFSGSKDWLNHYWTNAPKPVLFILDLLVFVLCGAYVGTGIYHPDSFVAALGAGLSWPVAFGALATKA
jgi:hypothetical protein